MENITQPVKKQEKTASGPMTIEDHDHVLRLFNRVLSRANSHARRVLAPAAAEQVKRYEAAIAALRNG